MANVSIEDVRGAVKLLKGTGVPVSVVSVRGQLGRGSSTTITRLLRDVREADAPADGLPSELDKLAPPIDVVERIANAARTAGIEAYRAIADPINQQIAAAREQITTERRAMQQDLDQVLADAGDAKEHAETLQRELTRLRELQVATTAELAALRAESGRRDAAVEAERRRSVDDLNQLRVQLAAAQELGRVTQQKLELALVEGGELRGKLAATIEQFTRVKAR